MYAALEIGLAVSVIHRHCLTRMHRLLETLLPRSCTRTVQPCIDGTLQAGARGPC